MSVFPASIGIKRYGAVELAALLAEMGEPAYRASQLLHWLYNRGVTDWSQMSNLPAALRQNLAAVEPLTPPQLLECLESADGSRKYLLQLADGEQVETVAIPAEGRLTVCFSTQVGCAMGCTFCATGRLGLTRSLAPGEMVDQLLVVAADFDRRVTNAVAMGEGEPLANYDATMAALRLMNSPNGLGIGARHLAISTCGILSGLRRLSSEPEQFTLAVSLHSAVQTTRDRLMPALAGNPLSQLRATLQNYSEKTGRRPTLEFALLSGINDTESELQALIEFCRGLLVHVNLIPLNPGGADDLSPSPAVRIEQIAAALQAAHIECSQRRSRGADIKGACGQLAACAPSSPK